MIRKSLGRIYQHNYEWINAEKEFRRVHDLNPATIEKNFLAKFIGMMDGPEETTRFLKDALIIDPLDINTLALGYVGRRKLRMAKPAPSYRILGIFGHLSLLPGT